MRLERDFQPTHIKEIETIFPGCLVLKGDSARRQGIPDLIILYEDKWAALEVKKSANEKARPNQPYYVDKMNEMSYSSFIYPENKEAVLRELQQAFSSIR